MGSDGGCTFFGPVEGLLTGIYLLEVFVLDDVSGQSLKRVFGQILSMPPNPLRRDQAGAQTTTVSLEILLFVGSTGCS